MSLYEPADGLLGTHVTWTDVEREMQRVLGTKATFGPNRQISDIGDMKGFMSKIAMIQADWIGASNEDIRNLPDRIAVKMSSELSLYNFSTLVCEEQWDVEKMKSMTSLVKELHNREVDMYRIIQRERPECPTVHVLALEAFTELTPLKAYIISEYIPNLRHIEMNENVPLEDIWSVVDGIAAFSAMGENMSETEKRTTTIGEIYIEEAIRYFFDEQSPDNMRRNLISLLGVAYEDKVEEAMDIFDLICGTPEIQKNYSRVSEFLGHSPVLMHSDIWPSNLLFSLNKQNKLEFKALIDFQTASLSSPGLDVACLMVTCLSKKDRRSSKSILLDRYYSSFCKSLKSPHSIPYSREQLSDSYDICFPAAVILMLPFILSFSLKLGDNIPEESVDKLAGIIEELVSIHKSNLIKFPKFFA
uniref:CHK domain-containing protein n=1 Tax=Caenorhabditis tropicalis TaxID=1561998 RepID=A0A1I7U2A8_9PELO